MEVKAIACELPAAQGAPLSRWSVPDVAERARQSGLVASISDSTVWRWLHEDAIRPWRYRSWIFPRDPEFAVKAGRILDLYEGMWEGQSLRKDEFVLSTDEKTSIQARARIHPTLPTQPGVAMKVEHEYKRCGAWAYLAALDVHAADEHGFGPAEIIVGGDADVLVDEADFPVLRHVGRDQQQPLRRHEGLHAVGERIGVFKRAE